MKRQPAEKARRPKGPRKVTAVAFRIAFPGGVPYQVSGRSGSDHPLYDELAQGVQAVLAGDPELPARLQAVATRAGSAGFDLDLKLSAGGVGSHESWEGAVKKVLYAQAAAVGPAEPVVRARADGWEVVCRLIPNSDPCYRPRVSDRQRPADQRTEPDLGDLRTPPVPPTGTARAEGPESIPRSAGDLLPGPVGLDLLLRTERGDDPPAAEIIVRAFADLLACDWERVDFTTVHDRLRAADRQFRAAAAALFGPVFNRKVQSFPTRTGNQKKYLAKWVNTTLAELRLAIGIPPNQRGPGGQSLHTGAPANLAVVVNADYPDGYFRLEHRPRPGRPAFTITLPVPLPTLPLVPAADPRRPGTAEVHRSRSRRPGR